MKSSIPKLGLITTLVLAYVSSTVMGENGASGLNRYQFSAPHMGTEFSLTFYASGEETANRASELAFARVTELNAIFSDYDASSEIRRLTAKTDANLGPVPVSLELWELLGRSLELSRQSAGAFDVTVGPLSQVWRRARRRRELPSPEEIAEASARVGYQRVALTDEGRLVDCAETGMRFDFGAIAKGYAADEALRVLKAAGVDRAMVDAGGNLALGISPPDTSGWKVGVAPLGSDEGPSRTLLLSDCGVASSGDAWQYMELDGVRYSHIIDPRTGWPLRERVAVTVVARSATEADGLSTAVSVSGRDAGLALVEKFAGAGALFLIPSAEGVQVAESPRFRELTLATRDH